MKGIMAIGTLAMSGLLAFLPASGTTAGAEALSRADMCFLEFVEEDLGGEPIENYRIKPLYDENLKECAWQYDFESDGVSGYALVAEVGSEENRLYEVEELFYGKASPFDACQGIPVYVTRGVYLDYRDGDFYELISGRSVSEEMVIEWTERGFGYGGGAFFEEQTQTIEYTRRELTGDYSIEHDLPNYYGTIGDTGCAYTAGAVVCGYYDQFHEELIPDWKSYTKFGPVFKYKTGGGQTIEDLIAKLHALMSGDSDKPGATYAQFQDGMQKYAAERGYTYTSSSVFSRGEFQFDLYKQSVEAGKPVVLFLSGFSMLNGIDEYTGRDVVRSGYCPLTHVEVGCGYKTYDYYTSNGKKTTSIYLKVASGLSDYNIGYLNINGGGNIDKAVSVEIR